MGLYEQIARAKSVLPCQKSTAFFDKDFMIPFKSERRKYERSKFRGPVELSWIDANGEKFSALGNCVNVSIFGMSIEVPRPVPCGARVGLQTQSTAFPDAATVCHCRRYGPWFRVGLRFAAPVVQKEILVDSAEFVV